MRQIENMGKHRRFSLELHRRTILGAYFESAARRGKERAGMELDKCIEGGIFWGIVRTRCYSGLQLRMVKAKDALQNNLIIQ